METLGQASAMVGFLFVDDVAMNADKAAKIMGDHSAEVLAAALTALTAVEQWDTESIEGALRTAVIEELGLKPKVAFGPVRLAITGRRVSPPLFESMELLGRECSLARIAALEGA
jgi:Glutamyl- and glutaminyl-tRNA synthetases